MSTELTIDDRPQQSRFVLLRGDEELGEAVYVRRGGVLVFTHTAIDEQQQERGLGSVLVAGALDHARRAGDRVEARCPFVAEFIERHPGYADLLVDEG
jgi:uncharacterized protein